MRGNLPAGRLAFLGGRAATDAVVNCAARQLERRGIALEHEHRVGVGEQCVDLDVSCPMLTFGIELASVLSLAER